MIDLTCANPACRRPFQTTTYQANHGRRYCSRKCDAADRCGPKRYNYKGLVKKTCPVCGGQFEREPWEAKLRMYCSPRCAGIARRRPPAMKTVPCKGCGENFDVPVYAKRTFCTMECYQGWRKHN